MLTLIRTLPILAATIASVTCNITDAVEPATAANSEDFFSQRILPIARAQRASSCTECHFAGVELRQYVLDDEASTFAALRSAGLIDVAEPGRSKLLQFIARKPEREDAILAKVRAEELAAFTAWIDAAVRNPSLLASSAEGRPIGTDLPPEVVRQMRSDRLLNSFVENIWVEMERCVNCHSPERNEKWRKEHGDQVNWLRPRDPAGTLAALLEQGDIDLDEPEKSLLLLKPLGIVEHAGHVKFPVGSRTDRQFRRFLNDYAASAKGTYRTVAELPRPAEQLTIATGQQLKVTDLPKEYGGRLMRVLLFRRDGDGWNKRPIATADSSINPKNGQWMNPVGELVDRADATQERLLHPRLLPNERYLAQIYIDRRDRAAKDPKGFEFTLADYVGEVELSGQWKPGWQQPKVISAKDLKKPTP